VARAIGVELARRDPGGAAIVASETGAGGAPAIATPTSARLARRVRELTGAPAGPAGRLCLVGDDAAAASRLAAERPAPLVLDGPPAACADHVALVAGPHAEPALALAVAESMERSVGRPALVVCRADDLAPWIAIGALDAGHSRVSALLAAAGREPRGALSAVARELADRWEHGPPSVVQEPW
jgi:hypothetical protein